MGGCEGIGNKEKMKEETKTTKDIRETITLLIKEALNKAKGKGEMKLDYFPS